MTDFVTRDGGHGTPLRVRLFLPVAVVAALLTAGTLEHPVSAAKAAHAARTPARVQGHGASWWADRAVANRRKINQLVQALHRDPSVVEAINSACATYGNCAELWRKAECESTLNPDARNASGAVGLFQFKPSTFRGTPYGRLDITSPYASALAAGWAIAHGHRSWWVCQ